MSSLRPLFLHHIAQTGPSPVMLEPERASGIYIYDVSGNPYVDLNSGYCVSVLGHCHPRVVEAVQKQAAIYMHTTVYGEHIQSPQVQLAKKLTEQLDPSLNCVFFVNSGAEAVEGAMKLAKRVTGRYEIVACHKAYHGSTQGADSLRSDLEYTSAFMPLLPGIRNIHFSNFDDLKHITETTAAVLIEPVQGEAGVRIPAPGYLQSLRKRCDETGALLIFDEIQTGMGRTGHLFAYQRYGVVPDVLLLAKSFGGGMPLGAFISRKSLLNEFTHDPALGHLTTFGGHPVSCAAALATLEELLEGDYMAAVESRAQRFISQLQHPMIREIRNVGLMMAVELSEGISLTDFIRQVFDHGVLTDWFLFDNRSWRISPPLIMNEEEIDMACERLIGILEVMYK
ncbi:MAG TPA: aspartate aminotransferase family protein [Saprospiraceae bacterium]|nr:aspartate aminotransferase family protein [Saprospiraceae bacterium]